MSVVAEVEHLGNAHRPRVIHRHEPQRFSLEHAIGTLPRSLHKKLGAIWHFVLILRSPVAPTKVTEGRLSVAVGLEPLPTSAPSGRECGATGYRRHYATYLVRRHGFSGSGVGRHEPRQRRGGRPSATSTTDAQKRSCPAALLNQRPCNSCTRKQRESEAPRRRTQQQECDRDQLHRLAWGTGVVAQASAAVVP